MTVLRTRTRGKPVPQPVHQAMFESLSRGAQSRLLQLLLSCAPHTLKFETYTKNVEESMVSEHLDAVGAPGALVSQPTPTNG